jgi:predicted nucleic acid-binding protein
MARFLLDTNHLGHCLHPTSFLRDRIRASERAGNRIGTIVPALCEVQVLVQGSKNPQQRQRFLGEVLRTVRVWPLDHEMAIRYGALYLQLRAAGRAISQVDLMLASMALSNGCRLLTADRDFNAIPNLKCANWLTT